MTNGCESGTLDESNYADPVPLIGMYIAAGSLICLLLMLIDIISAWHYRKRWIPCWAFKLNSVTLTLLGISSKLTVDLTTPMPNLEDQISKLTGTILLCILMGFLNPSVGGSESFTNMAALSILVITSIANICIQIYSGVIFMFIVEHVIIMGFMCLLLFSLWSCAWDVRYWKEFSLEITKRFIRKGDKTMLKRLELCSIYGFRSNPQLSICLEASNVTTGGFCLFCFFVLAEATFRSIVFKPVKFCRGVSDYRWTISIIVIVQILTIVVGCFATTFRWFTMLYPGYYTNTGFWEADSLVVSSPILGARPKDIFVLYLTRVFGYLTRHFARLITVFSSFFFSPGLCSLTDHANEDVVQDYKDQIQDPDSKRDPEANTKAQIELNVWIVWKAVNDMNDCMKVCTSQPMKHLPKFLSITAPPSWLLDNMQIKDIVPPKDLFEVSSLTIALLVRIASISLPNLAKTLEDTFLEAYEIIDYVQTQINPISLENRKISKITNALLRGEGLHIYLSKIIEGSSGEFHSLSELQQALVIFEELEKIMSHKILSNEVTQINFLLVQCGQYDTMEGLYNHVQELYVSMLHLFFAQFPNVVFRDLNESSAEEFQERAKNALMLLCKIEPMESYIQWSFPSGRKMSSLINPPIESV